MSYKLIAGCESEYRFNILVGFTDLRSKPIIAALKLHLVDGVPEKFAVMKAFNGAPVKQGNFNRSLAALNRVASEVEKLKEHDWAKFNYKSESVE